MIPRPRREGLASRIEQLMAMQLDDWLAQDALSFMKRLPNSSWPYPDRKLPWPQVVRAESFTEEQYQVALHRCLDMESLAGDNRPNSPRQLRAGDRGIVPGMRR